MNTTPGNDSVLNNKLSSKLSSDIINESPVDDTSTSFQTTSTTNPPPISFITINDELGAVAPEQQQRLISLTLI